MGEHGYCIPLNPITSPTISLSNFVAEVDVNFTHSRVRGTGPTDGIQFVISLILTCPPAGIGSGVAFPTSSYTTTTLETATFNFYTGGAFGTGLTEIVYNNPPVTGIPVSKGCCLATEIASNQTESFFFLFLHNVPGSSNGTFGALTASASVVVQYS